MRGLTYVLALPLLAGLASLVTFAVGLGYGRDGALSLLAATALAPVAVTLVGGLGTRVGGRGIGIASAATYVLLPLAATGYFLADYDHTYLHRVLPDLVGTRALAWFALGLAVVAAARFAPAPVLAAAGLLAAIVAVAIWGTGSLGDVKTSLHETGWSVALLEWLPVAGVLGAARRSPWLAVGLGGWLVFFVLRAAQQPLETGAFWRAVAPALPAAAILVASLWLLVPSLRAEPARGRAPARPDAP